MTTPGTFKSLLPAELEKQILTLPPGSVSLKEVLQTQTFLKLDFVFGHDIPPVK
jgi:hypothetical protein